MIGNIKNFRFWCQKVLPLVYDNSLSYYEVLCKVVHYLNHVIEDINEIPEYIDEKVKEAFDEEHLRELISEIFITIEDAITNNNEGTNAHFSKDYPDLGTLLWHDNKLYRTIRKIDAGDTILVDTNIELVSFADMFEEFISNVKDEFSPYDDGQRETASANRSVHTLIWLDDELYEVIKPITEGNAYIYTGENQNVDKTSINSIFQYILTLIADEIESVKDDIEAEAHTREEEDVRIELALEELLASEVSARIESDDEIISKIGDLSELETVSKDNLVDAINEVDERIDNLKSPIYYNVKDYGAIGDGVHDDTQAFTDAIATANSNNGTVFIPATSNFYLITSELTLTGKSFILGEKDAEIHFTGTNLFKISGYYGSIENLIIVGNNNNNAIYFDLDTGVVWVWRFKHLHIQHTTHAFWDNVTGVNYIVDCIFDDIICDYTYGTQFLSNRSRGFITMRNFKCDNTENRRDIIWDSIVIRDIIGLEMEGVDVVGPVSRDSYVVNAHQNAWGIKIEGAGSGTASIWLTRVLVDTAPINGIVISDINYINGNYIEAFSVTGSCLLLERCTNINLSNLYAHGSSGVSYAAAGASGVSFNTCARVNAVNVISEYCTGNGIVIFNTGKLSMSNVQALYNELYGYYEGGSSDANSVVNAHYDLNTTGQIVQSGADSIHTAVELNGTTTASIKGTYNS